MDISRQYLIDTMQTTQPCECKSFSSGVATGVGIATGLGIAVAVAGGLYYVLKKR